MEGELQRRGGQQASVDAGVLRLEVDTLKASVQHHQRRVVEMERELQALRETEKATRSVSSERSSGQSEEAEEGERSLKLAQEVVGSQLPPGAPKPLRSPNSRALLGLTPSSRHAQAAAELLQAAQYSAEGLDAASSGAKKAVRRDAGESRALAKSIVRDAERALEAERENLKSQKRMLSAVDQDAGVQLRQLENVRHEESAVAQLNHMLKATCDFKARVYEDLATKRSSIIDLLLRAEETLDGSSVVEVAQLLADEEEELETTSARAQRKLARMEDAMDNVARRSSRARREIAGEMEGASLSEDGEPARATGATGTAALTALERRAHALEEDMARGKREEDCPRAAVNGRGEARSEQKAERKLTGKEQRLQRGLFDVFEGAVSAAASQGAGPAKGPEEERSGPQKGNKRSPAQKSSGGGAQRVQREMARPHKAARVSPARRRPAPQRSTPPVAPAAEQRRVQKDLTLPEASRAVQQKQETLEVKRATLMQAEAGLEQIRESVESAHNRTRELQERMSARAEKLAQNQARTRAAREKKLRLAAAAKEKEAALQKARAEAEKAAQRAIRLRELYGRLSNVLRQDAKAEEKVQEHEPVLLETAGDAYEVLRKEAAELGVELPAEKTVALSTLKGVVEEKETKVSGAEVTVERLQQETEAAAQEAAKVEAEVQQLGEEAKTLTHDLQGLREEHESASKELASVSVQYEDTLRKVQEVEAEVSQLESSFADASQTLERALEDAEGSVEFGATGSTGATGVTGATGAATAQSSASELELGAPLGPTGAVEEAGLEAQTAAAATGSRQPSPTERGAATGAAATGAIDAAALTPEPKQAVKREWPKWTREEMKATLEEHDAIVQQMLHTSVPSYAEELAHKLRAMQDRYRVALHWDSVYHAEEPAATTAATGAADAASTTAEARTRPATVKTPTVQTPQSLSKQSMLYSVEEARSMPCARAESCAAHRRAAVRAIIAASQASTPGLTAALGGGSSATGATGSAHDADGMGAVDKALARAKTQLTSAATLAPTGGSGTHGFVSGGDMASATGLSAHREQEGPRRASARSSLHTIRTMATRGNHFQRRMKQEIDRVEKAFEDGMLPELIYDEEEAGTGPTGAAPSGTGSASMRAVDIEEEEADAKKEEEDVEASTKEKMEAEVDTEKETDTEELMGSVSSATGTARLSASSTGAASVGATGAAKPGASDRVWMPAAEASTGELTREHASSRKSRSGSYQLQMEREFQAVAEKGAKDLANDQELSGKLRFAGDADYKDLIARVGADSVLEVGEEGDAAYCDSTWVSRKDGALCLRSNDHKCLVAGGEGDKVRVVSEVGLSQASLRGNLDSVDGGVRATHWKLLEDGRIALEDRPSLCLTVGASGDSTGEVTLEVASTAHDAQQTWLLDTTRD